MLCTQAAADPVRVIDGDTIEVRGEVIRLVGIDAPEIGQTCGIGPDAIDCGEAARAALVAILGGEVPRCAATGSDRYRRTLAICHAAGQDIARALVLAGWATAFRRYSTRYIAEEAAARAAHAGAWGLDHLTPNQHRSRR